MRYLIDGYNLLFASGRLTPRVGPAGLESARRFLLRQLQTAPNARAADITVVFDSRQAPPGVPTRTEHAGIGVMFSRGGTADDVIEDLIRRESTPALLTVVSDDRRLQQAARRRGCPVLGCLDYLEHLTRTQPAPGPEEEPAAKPEAGSPEEVRRWLAAFKDVEDDPEWRGGY